MNDKKSFLKALLQEVELQKKYLSEPVETLYFGGGTPSLLSADEISGIINAVKQNFDVIAEPECTLEANPEDLTEDYLFSLAHTAINRLSIGIQSFDSKRLAWMNRSHTGAQAKQCVVNANNAGIKNISVDLIFGLPEMNLNEWEFQLKQAVALSVNHISCYCLTVEEKTVLANRVKKNLEKILIDEEAQKQFLLADEFLEANGFEHYEISNFAKHCFKSKHNSSYWEKKIYLGLGPSAHSYNLKSRQWNQSNTKSYIANINEGNIPATSEQLNTAQQFNEYLMTGLRTAKGVNALVIENDFGKSYMDYFYQSAKKLIDLHHLIHKQNTFTIDKKHWFMADYLIAELFHE